MTKGEQWDIIIEPKKKWWDIDFKDILNHYDLMVLFVKRDIVSFYKQTILGPLWFFIQPLFTMGVYLFVFKRLAGLSTEGLPGPVFYLTGIVFWTYYSTTLLKVATTLNANKKIFGKVYFPRIIVPISVVLSNLFRLMIQMLLLVGIIIYHIVFKDMQYDWSLNFLYFPLFFALMAFQALGFGLMVTGLTTKYRDLAMLLTFGIQLLMYLSAVVYPISSLEGTALQYWVRINPASQLFEGMRFALYNVGTFELVSLWSAIFQTLFILAVGVVVFNRVERGFVDTI